MKKKRYFVQLFLKNGDTICLLSYSKKRVLRSYKLYFNFFDSQLSLTTSNFDLK